LVSIKYEKSSKSLIEAVLLCLKLSSEVEEGKKVFSKISFELASKLSNLIEIYKDDESLVYSILFLT
jgi:hypothetical protein